MMYSSHIKSLVDEKTWLFQLKYFPFYAKWMVYFLPFIWLLFMLLWLPKVIFNFLIDKNILVIILTVGIVSLSSIYLYAILGNPDQLKWKNTIFNNHIKRISINIYDKTDNMIGGLVNKEIDVNKGIFYVENIQYYTGIF